MGVNTTTIQLQITMRCAIFLAIACVAMSAPTTEENIQAEEVNPLTSAVNPLTSEVSGQEIVEAYHPVNKKTKDSNALATNGRKLLGSGGRRRRANRCTRRGNLVRWGGGGNALAAICTASACCTLGTAIALFIVGGGGLC